jgi:hypothetical protein
MNGILPHDFLSDTVLFLVRNVSFKSCFYSDWISFHEPDTRFVWYFSCVVWIQIFLWEFIWTTSQRNHTRSWFSILVCNIFILSFSDTVCVCAQYNYLIINQYNLIIRSIHKPISYHFVIIILVCKR